jgi:hypothetical protein
MRKSTSSWPLPDVSPLIQNDCRERDQYVTLPLANVRLTASSFIHAIINTTPDVYACAITGIRPDSL